MEHLNEKSGQKLKVYKPEQEKSDSDKLDSETELVKVFGDPIHGNIEVHPLLVKIIDTPQFQRLRNLKQLGVTYFVYPGAAHNRFEHSIGVSHLAGKLARHLRKKQPELDISDEDILCLRIAGLCHDLGHGPFSHTFENRVIPKTRPDIRWKHEYASVKMFEYLVEQNELKQSFVDNNLLENDMTFIKELIAGPMSPSPAQNRWPYKGRESRKGFLYQIVANSVNGVDVDKWDYVTRDSYHLNVPISFDHRRLIKFARVIRDPNNPNASGDICVRDKEIDSLYHMCQARHHLHRIAYQHKNTVIIDYMLGEALISANEHIRIKGIGGKERKMSDAIDDMEALTKLDDSIFNRILRSRDANLREARQILEDIERRNLYRFVGQAKPKMDEHIDDIRRYQDIDKKLAGALENRMTQKSCTNASRSIVVQLCVLHFGMGLRNPIDFVQFYSKLDKDRAEKPSAKEDVLLRGVYSGEFTIRVYCRNRDDSELIKAAIDCFPVVCVDLELRHGQKG